MEWIPTLKGPGVMTWMSRVARSSRQLSAGSRTSRSFVTAGSFPRKDGPWPGGRECGKGGRGMMVLERFEATKEGLERPDWCSVASSWGEDPIGFRVALEPHHSCLNPVPRLAPPDCLSSIMAPRKQNRRRPAGSFTSIISNGCESLHGNSGTEVTDELLNSAPDRPAPPLSLRRPSPTPIAPWRVASDLEELLPAFPHALSFLNNDEMDQPESILELTRTEIGCMPSALERRRKKAILGRLVAARRAAEAFARRHRDATLNPIHVSVDDPSADRPQLRCADAALESLLSGVDLSLAESQDFSVAVVGVGSVSVEWQAIENRRAEDWRSQLSEPGYQLALALMPFGN